MNLQRCEKGHFYDVDIHSSCPHCNPTLGNTPLPPEDNAKSTVLTQPVDVVDLNDAVDVSGAFTTDLSILEQEETPDDALENYERAELNSGKTVGMFASGSDGAKPVVGWLVCVEGPNYGEDFRLVAGRNFIGRANNMDVVLSKDMAVSRNKHLVIIYDPVQNEFIVQAGESKELAYHNGKAIIEPTKVNANDTIKLGESILMLVPFCSDTFSWE